MVGEEVVSGPAELVAAEAVVVLGAGHADLVLEVRDPRVVLERLPLPAGVDHARVRGLLDNAVGVCRHKTRQAETSLQVSSLTPTSQLSSFTGKTL